MKQRKLDHLYINHKQNSSLNVCPEKLGLNQCEIVTGGLRENSCHN